MIEILAQRQDTSNEEWTIYTISFKHPRRESYTFDVVNRGGVVTFLNDLEKAKILCHQDSVSLVLTAVRKYFVDKKII